MLFSHPQPGFVTTLCYFDGSYEFDVDIGPIGPMFAYMIHLAVHRYEVSIYVQHVI